MTPSDSPTTVRTAGPDDAEALARVHVTAWQEAYAHVVSSADLAGIDVGERTARWRERLAGGARVWLGGVDGTVVGFASAGPARGDDPPRPLELYALYVLRAVYGTGIGQQLFDAALGDAPAYLWVLADNPRARAFYARNGFVADGAAGHHELVGHRVALVRMVR